MCCHIFLIFYSHIKWFIFSKCVSSCEYVDAANDVFWYYNYDDNLRGRNPSKTYVTRRELTKNVRVTFMILVKIFRHEVAANIAIHEVAYEMKKEFPVVIVGSWRGVRNFPFT